MTFYGKGKWEISVVPGGYMDSPKGVLAAGFEEDMRIDLPFQAFLLRNGTKNILVDTCVNEIYYPYESDDGTTKYFAKTQQFVDSLKSLGVVPEDIDFLIFTHLHADHAGNAKLFPLTKTIVQKDERTGSLNPCFKEKLARLYDPDMTSVLSNNKNLIEIDGDMEIMEGIKLIKVPGHTKGSQAIIVNTVRGFRVLVGDLFHLPICCFPWIDTLTDYHGATHKVTPAPDWPVMPSNLVFSFYDYYVSAAKIKALLPELDPQYVICGHDGSLMYREF